MDILQTKPILTAVSVVGVTLLGYFFTRLYAAQMLMVKLQTQGCVSFSTLLYERELRTFAARSAWAFLLL